MKILKDKYICSICGTGSFKNYFRKHVVNVHNLGIKDYYDIYNKSKDEGTCKNCGKPTLFKKPQKGIGYREFCSRSCVFTYTHKSIKEDPIRKSQWAEKSSDTMKRMWKSPIRPKRWGHKRGNITEYKNILFRSSWESKFAKILDENNIEWQYEEITIPRENGRIYLPDFYIPIINTYIEITPDFYIKDHVPKVVDGIKAGNKVKILTELNWDKVLNKIFEKARSQKCGK